MTTILLYWDEDEIPAEHKAQLAAEHDAQVALHDAMFELTGLEHGLPVDMPRLNGALWHLKDIGYL